MRFHITAFTVVAAVAVGSALPAAASSSERIELGDIVGDWEGSGFVQKNEAADPITVRCQVTGRQDIDQIGFDGSCRAMLIFKRPIGVDLTREGNALNGTYEGSAMGISQLQGEVETRDELILDMTFPKEVNGDDKAVMTIENRLDEDQFTIRTRDVMASGVAITTSEIIFQRTRDAASN